MKPELSVLLVEDDPNVRLGCEQAMQLAGITVDAVGSAEEAQEGLTAEEQEALARARRGEQDKRDADLLRNLESKR